MKEKNHPETFSILRAHDRLHGTDLEQQKPVLCVQCHADPALGAAGQPGIPNLSGGMHTAHASRMAAVGDLSRRPWVDEPRCGDCQSRSGFEFEQTSTLFKDAKGHNGVHCAACHGSPHAITPTVVAADNVQAIALQGHAGVINTCTVCHQQRPDDSFNHSLDD